MVEREQVHALRGLGHAAASSSKANVAAHLAAKQEDPDRIASCDVETNRPRLHAGAIQAA
jgi:hypothetical protein